MKLRDVVLGDWEAFTAEGQILVPTVVPPTSFFGRAEVRLIPTEHTAVDRLRRYIFNFLDSLQYAPRADDSLEKLVQQLLRDYFAEPDAPYASSRTAKSNGVARQPNKLVPSLGQFGVFERTWRVTITRAGLES